MSEQLPVILQVDVRLVTQVLHALQEANIAFISGARRMEPLRSIQSVEVMQFLNRRHPKIGMSIELLINPRGSRFLSAHAQEIRTCIAGGTVMLFSIVTVIDPRFEWPGQTHVGIFSQAP